METTLPSAAGPDAPEEKSLAGADDQTVRFLVEAFDRTTGERRWRYELESEPVGESLQPVHRKHNLSSSSPVTDGEHIYAWFGTGQLVALTIDGRLAWEKHLAREYSPFDITWGHSSSPTVHEDKLLLLCDHEPASYLLALDKQTGKELWKVDRGSGLRSYSTPTIVDSASGPEIIVNSSKGLDAYDPDTGERKWYYPEDNRFPIPAPSFGDGIIFTSRGYRSGPYMAIRPGGSGDITQSEHLLWRVPTGAPYVSAVVQYQGIVFLASDAGVLQAVDAKNGERLWQSRTGGVFSASPVAGDGKVYFASETGEILVIRAGREFELIASNDMGVRFLASPVISGGNLFLRTDGELFAVGN